MSKVSSKYQITLPRSLARAHQIVPGEEVVFEEAGSALYLRRGQKDTQAIKNESIDKLKRFDLASARQKSRDRTWSSMPTASDRGWTREELYQR
jgi:bifunctional DNA-binding transcriptional regulator/antitoxin component of YhaV-PrlF toxin-antitoxin module